MPIISKEALERAFAVDNNKPENANGCILVTGGAGYIGSHTVLELLKEGYEVVVVDDLANSCRESLERVSQLTKSKVHFHQVSICEQDALSNVFSQYPDIKAVIHFAGLKSVTESASTPLKYYTVNVCGSVILIDVMIKHNVFNLVFSSSATVYGHPEVLPIPETHAFGPTNPYGRSKLMVEDIIRDTCASDQRLNVAILRYFNPVGAHESGRIGEDPKGIPNNLMPYLSQVLVGKRPQLNVYGSDYATRDGTGVRDFIHVVDLAQGHIAACKHLTHNSPGCVTYNMGTGTGYSVLEMIAGMEKASGMKIKFEFVERRPGDVGEVVADPTKAKKEIGWNAQKTVLDMCVDTWRWQRANPNGYSLEEPHSKEIVAVNVNVNEISTPVKTEFHSVDSPTTENEENDLRLLNLKNIPKFIDHLSPIFLSTPRKNFDTTTISGSPAYLMPIMTLEDIRRTSLHGHDGLSLINMNMIRGH